MSLTISTQTGICARCIRSGKILEIKEIYNSGDKIFTVNLYLCKKCLKELSEF